MDYIEIIRLRRLFMPYLTDDTKDKNTKNAILNYLKTLNQHRLTITPLQKEILVHISSNDKDQNLITYRTNMTALPLEVIDKMNSLSAKQGIRTACGYDIHIAIALGLITEILNNNLDHTFLFIFQSDDQRNTIDLLNSKLLRQYSISEVYGIQFESNLNINELVIQDGTLYSFCREFRIDIMTTQTNPFLVNDANTFTTNDNNRSTELIFKLQSLIQKLANDENTVISFRKIHSKLVGESNDRMMMLEGTIRTPNLDNLKRIKTKLKLLVKKIIESYNCTIELTYGMFYNAVYNHPDLYNSTMNYFKNKRDYQIIKSKPYSYGNDFGEYTTRYKGFLIILGVYSKYPILAPKILPNEIIIQKTLRLLYFYFKHRIVELNHKKVLK